jgi:uncharacterized C2H2 Zn-finger protein
MANSQQLTPNTITVHQAEYHCNVCTFKASDEIKLKIHSNKHTYLKAVHEDYKILASGKGQFEDAYFCTTCNLSFSKKSLIAYHNKYQCKNVVVAQKFTDTSAVSAESINISENANSRPKESTVVSEDDNSDCSEDYYDSSYKSTSTRKRKIVDPILIQNPKSTLPKFRCSQKQKLNALVNLNDKHVPDDVRVLNIATAQIIDRSIKCFRCNLFFKTHKDLKTHLDKWHSDELMQLSNQFTNNNTAVHHRCTGCSMNFPTVRSATKHYYKDCTGNASKSVHNQSISKVIELHQETKNVLEEIESEMIINDGSDASNNASDAELLTYLQNAAHNSQVTSHHLSVEDHLIKIASMQVNDRTIKCIRCNLPFASHKELNLHLTKVHGKELDELNNQCQTYPFKVQHKCSKCTLAFPSVRLLTRHYQECKAQEPHIFSSTPSKVVKQVISKPRRSPRKKHNIDFS